MAYTKNQMMQMLNIEAEANKLRKLKEEYAKSNNEKIVRSGYIIFSKILGYLSTRKLLDVNFAIFDYMELYD